MMLYFEDTKTDKPPLVLIAGVASDDLSWSFQKEALAQDFRLITFDNRGVGRSPVPAGPYSVPSMAEDVLALLDHLGLERVHLLGHSMGGAIAQHLAIECPQRVDRLLLVCTFSSLRPRNLAILESWCATISNSQNRPRDIGNALFPWLYTEEFLDQPGVLEAAHSALASHPFPLSAEGVTSQVEALRSFDSGPHLHRIQAPTVVISADGDLLVPPALGLSLAEAIPGAELERLPNTGHACMLETPELFNRAVLDGLKTG